MKEIIKVKDDRIESHILVADSYIVKENEFEVSKWHGKIGDSTKLYNSDWTRKTQVELIQNGLAEIPRGYKIEDDELVEMTREEKVENGLELLLSTEKLEKGKIVDKTEIEMYKDGTLTIPDGYKIEADELVEMPLQEKVENGFIKLDSREKIENNQIVLKTEEELFNEGLISKTEFNEYLIDKQKEFLFETDWVITKTLEMQLTGKEITHDYSDIIAERQKAREIINELEKE